jgi:uncharacterized membrane protein
MANHPKESKSVRVRYPLIDVLRGSAIAMMIVYHFCFDLSTFGYARFDFYHSQFWLNFQILIVSIFTFVMGMSFHLAHKRQYNWPGYLKRLGLLGFCAILISISTYIVNGDRFIYFGILHFFFVASILALLFVRFYWINLILGTTILSINILYQHPLFNKIYLQWIGLMTYKPATDDYEPVIPWFGMVLIGMFFAQWAITRGNLPLFSRWKMTSRMSRLFRFAGVHSLIIYMLHQPIFYALFNLYSWVTGTLS